MKIWKIIGIFLLLIGLDIGILFFAGNNRGLTAFHNPLDGERSQSLKYIEQNTINFLEDIRFKDFDKAASYHTQADQEKVDIPYLIERLFEIKPEMLDIMRYEITSVELDRSGLRGRVKTHTVAKCLNTDEIKNVDIIYYWMKDPQEGWCMKLESSLHAPSSSK